MRLDVAQLEADVADEKIGEHLTKPAAWTRRPPLSELFRLQRERELADEKRLSGWDR